MTRHQLQDLLSKFAGDSVVVRITKSDGSTYTLPVVGVAVQSGVYEADKPHNPVLHQLEIVTERAP